MFYNARIGPDQEEIVLMSSWYHDIKKITDDIQAAERVGVKLLAEMTVALLSWVEGCLLAEPAAVVVPLTLACGPPLAYNLYKWSTDAYVQDCVHLLTEESIQADYQPISFHLPSVLEQLGGKISQKCGHALTDMGVTGKIAIYQYMVRSIRILAGEATEALDGPMNSDSQPMPIHPATIETMEHWFATKSPYSYALYNRMVEGIECLFVQGMDFIEY